MKKYCNKLIPTKEAEIVTPAKAGVQIKNDNGFPLEPAPLDSRFRGNDREGVGMTKRGGNDREGVGMTKRGGNDKTKRE